MTYYMYPTLGPSAYIDTQHVQHNRVNQHLSLETCYYERHSKVRSFILTTVPVHSWLPCANHMHVIPVHNSYCNRASYPFLAVQKYLVQLDKLLLWELVCVSL